MKRIWLITVGEPLPTDPDQERLLRTGIIADMLASRGVDVTWWTSTFDHRRKVQRADRDVTTEVRPGYRIKMLHGPGYTRHVSFARILAHRATARAFVHAAKEEPRPDIILCSFPTLELSLEAVRYGKRNKRPVVLDVRDLWPDIMVHLAPPMARGLARLALWPMFWQARTACREATAICAITEPFVDAGLKNAGRGRTDRDRVFSFGYPVRPPGPDQLRQAEQRWDELGVTRGPERLTVSYCGSITCHLDFATVIRAAETLRSRGKRVRFVICGAGDDLERYRRMAAGRDDVLFPGWVNAAAIWSLMRRSDVGLAPYVAERSFEENIPNKIPEMFSASLPVVLGLKRGIVAQMLHDDRCGLVYAPGDAGELADALVRLQDNPVERAEFGRNAGAVFTSRFRADVVYGNYIDHLAGLAEAGSRAVPSGR